MWGLREGRSPPYLGAQGTIVQAQSGGFAVYVQKKKAGSGAERPWAGIGPDRRQGAWVLLRVQLVQDQNTREFSGREASAEETTVPRCYRNGAERAENGGLATSSASQSHFSAGKSLSYSGPLPSVAVFVISV